MRLPASWLCLALAAIGGVPKAAADEYVTCLEVNEDEAIPACSRAIVSGKYEGRDLSTLYLMRGSVYGRKKDYDRAIADYTQAIQFDPKNSTAYHQRGMTRYVMMGDFNRSIADLTQAIQLRSNFVVGYYDRGNMYRNKFDYGHAIADYTQAIQIDPKFAVAYISRGIVELYAGQLAKALADINQANELHPERPYTALWLDIIGYRNNLPSRLAETSKRIDMTNWPAAVIRLYLGQLTPEAVLTAADNPDPMEKRIRVAETNFFSGQLALRRSLKEEAMRLFRLTVSDSDKTSSFWFAANAELKALGVNP